MHSELIPMPNEEEGEGLGAELVGPAAAGYSHYGEFQALLKKWTNREVEGSPNINMYLLTCFFPVGCSSVCESPATVSL